MHTRKSGFTVLEIMAVVAIIGLLSALAMPAFIQSRRKVQNTRFINDLRVASAAFEQRAIATGVFPRTALYS
ncbi:MAG: type II secretion system protein [Verrucomicrobia bacterium]|nr:type II secretion system protein [Verrucomicrobiota bacterium]